MRRFTKQTLGVALGALALIAASVVVAPAANAAPASRGCSSLTYSGSNIIGSCYNSDPRVPLQFNVSCWGIPTQRKAIDVGYGGSFNTNVCGFLAVTGVSFYR